jgi:TPR repeat protein
LALGLLAGAGAGAATAQGYADGRAAYDARDWDAAEALWRAEAEAGSAEALLGLGNLYDFGLLGAPDPERAFGLYLRAAEGGVAEAAFNVGVMQDGGIGTAPDRDAAAAWYAFAGLAGHVRAQYAAGLLLAEGPEASPGLAAFWLGRVADRLPAAEEALAGLAPLGEGPLAPPEPLLARVFDGAAGPEARMAWRAGPLAPDARFRVDVVRLDGEFERLGSAVTEGSAAAVALPGDGRGFAWRVAQLSGDAYAASPWQPGPGATLDRQPQGAVRFEYAEGNRRAEGLALRLAGALTRAGVIVSHRPLDAEPDASRVLYGFGSDRGLASDVSAFLPGSDGAAEPAPGADLAPGEVAMVLSFAASPEAPGAAASDR